MNIENCSILYGLAMNSVYNITHGHVDNVPINTVDASKTITYVGHIRGGRCNCLCFRVEGVVMKER